MKVTLFIPCLIDQFMPEAAYSMINILKKCGVEYFVDGRQTCCGQANYNMGHHKDARELAARFMDIYKNCAADYIIIPSGSCAAMVKNSYETLMPEITGARVFEKIIEFSDFLHKFELYKKLKFKYRGAIFYHKSCHLLNEMGIDGAPKAILNSIDGLKFLESQVYDNTCCGFGGSFSAALSDLSMDIGRAKLDFIVKKGINTIVACDAGCLMHLRSVSEASNLKLKFYHFSEFIDLCSN